VKIKICKYKYCGKEIKIDWKRKKHNNVYCNSECSGKDRFLKNHELFKKGEISQRHTLRNHLIYDRGHKCEICKSTEWCGKPIGLIVDHIDGNWRDSTPQNLRLVCGNCDMQLPTYKAKNKGKGRPTRRVKMPS
jgi:hypothetical protein